ncbi:hypothetical protein P1X14_07310 [Sphingomonas sp. AOB5]|uniref:hypothetical protein n=1 Tax=Sphingomonas sp. AOB5 TaxID=3034017 RepID=UPI0023F9ED39|nr:hypothetical protein [Sphingomonas sp. AOB5]MDF7775048.1 hypothetical protein [Sphingomonas sp. AOB5]
MRLLLLLAFVLLLPVPAAQAQVIGAFQTDCRLGGEQTEGSYQFVVECPGKAWSPDRRFAVVQRPYRQKQPVVELQDARGRTLTRFPTLTDEMPFTVHWAPNSRRFFVNHYVGSSMSVLRVFEIVGQRAVERRALPDAAVRIATRRYPCLPPHQVLPNGARWTRDSQRIVLVTISRPDACGDFYQPRGDWQSLWMIGDMATGRIDPASIRVDRGNTGLTMPRDGAYSRP